MGNDNSQLTPTMLQSGAVFNSEYGGEDAISLSNAGTVIHFVRSSKNKEMNISGFHHECKS
jgi:hypothetical protein